MTHIEGGLAIRILHKDWHVRGTNLVDTFLKVVSTAIRLNSAILA